MRNVNRSSKSISRSSRARVAKAIQPGLETLETRRLLASAGDPDISFDGDGWNEVVTDISVGFAVAVDGSNNVIVAGVNGVTSHLEVARFLSTGALDTTFSQGDLDGVDGVFSTSVLDEEFNLPGGTDIAYDVKVFGGKIYVAGTFENAGDSGVFVFRLDSTGALDATFDANGIATANTAGNQSGKEMAIDGAGNVYVVGEYDANSLVVKFSSSGVFDTTFGDLGDGGFAGTELIGNATQVGMGGIGLQSVGPNAGKIIIGGNTGLNGVLARLNVDGTRDTDFGTNGVTDLLADANATFSNLVVGAGDRIYVGGSSSINPPDQVGIVVAFDSGGTPISAFDGDGEAIVDKGTVGVSVVGEGIALDGAGNVILSGFILDGTLVAFVARFNQVNGSLDTVFGANGFGTQAADGFADAFEVAVDGNGKIVTGGSSSAGLMVARFLSVDDAPPVTPVFVDINGNLVIPGTAGNDIFDVQDEGGGDVRVIYNGVDSGIWEFSGIIRITGLGGDDLITIESTVAANADITGAAGNDTIVSGGGSDTITGGAGNDSIVGGGGADSITGAAGNDTLLGQGGNDTLRGGAGMDSLDGGADNDDIHGGADNDTAVGGSGNDSIANDGGNDELFGGLGNDTLRAGGGDDVAYGEGGNDSLIGGTGNDSLFGGADNDTINGGAGNDFIDGESGNDDLNGGAGTDIVLGGLGNDIVQGGAERDLLIGGDGADSMLGNADEDILVAATTSNDGNEANLKSILATWDGPGTYAARRDALLAGLLNPSNLFDDGDVDTLTGGAGTDWFILDTVQDINDQKAGETETGV